MLEIRKLLPVVVSLATLFSVTSTHASCTATCDRTGVQCQGTSTCASSDLLLVCDWQPVMCDQPAPEPEPEPQPAPAPNFDLSCSCMAIECECRVGPDVGDCGEITYDWKLYANSDNSSLYPYKGSAAIIFDGGCTSGDFVGYTISVTATDRCGERFSDSDVLRLQCSNGEGPGPMM